MKQTMALAILFLLAAALLFGCPQQLKPGGEEGNKTTSPAPAIKPADVPDYNESIDSDIDDLAGQLG